MIQIRGNIISVSNQIKRNILSKREFPSNYLMIIVFKSAPHELIHLEEGLRNCKVLDKLADSAVANNQKAEKTLAKLFQKQLSNTIEFRGLCESIKFELSARSQSISQDNPLTK